MEVAERKPRGIPPRVPRADLAVQSHGICARDRTAQQAPSVREAELQRLRAGPHQLRLAERAALKLELTRMQRCLAVPAPPALPLTGGTDENLSTPALLQTPLNPFFV